MISIDPKKVYKFANAKSSLFGTFAPSSTSNSPPTLTLLSYSSASVYTLWYLNYKQDHTRPMVERLTNQQAQNNTQLKEVWNNLSIVSKKCKILWCGDAKKCTEELKSPRDIRITDRRTVALHWAVIMIDAYRCWKTNAYIPLACLFCWTKTMMIQRVYECSLSHLQSHFTNIPYMKFN